MIDLDTARAEIAGTVGAEAFAGLFERSGASALVREGTSEHVTASCLLIDPVAEAVLLNHHRKAGRWMQFGGHLEPGDVSLREAARREALEESGLGSLSWISPAPIDLDIHALAGDFGSCRRHFDVVYGAVAAVADLPAVSDESIDVAWFPVSALPEDLMPDLVERLPRLYRATAEEYARTADEVVRGDAG